MCTASFVTSGDDAKLNDLDELLDICWVEERFKDEV